MFFPKKSRKISKFSIFYFFQMSTMIPLLYIERHTILQKLPIYLKFNMQYSGQKYMTPIRTYDVIRHKTSPSIGNPIQN